VGARTASVLLLYFACLGYGFMMIEIPLLQRFVLFLGYPIYALAVVLFALLMFSGLGSLLSARLGLRAEHMLVRVLAGIVALATLYIAAVPTLIAVLIGESLTLRIALTVVLLAPIGLLLGMAYPLGIAMLREFDERLVPWAWALNGALSVVASVLAIFLGSRFGFTTAFLTGVGAYGIALAVAVAVNRREPGATVRRPLLSPEGEPKVDFNRQNQVHRVSVARLTLRGHLRGGSDVGSR
jgi:MFS family permease